MVFNVLCSINTDFGKEQSFQNFSHHHTAAVHLLLHVDEVEALDDNAVSGLRYVWFCQMKRAIKSFALSRNDSLLKV